jgi:hypothetical protein
MIQVTVVLLCFSCRIYYQCFKLFNLVLSILADYFLIFFRIKVYSLHIFVCTTSSPCSEYQGWVHFPSPSFDVLN